MEWIEIKHATQNNLKNISVNIPKKQLTVVTGLSLQLSLTRKK